MCDVRDFKKEGIHFDCLIEENCKILLILLCLTLKFILLFFKVIPLIPMREDSPTPSAPPPPSYDDVMSSGMYPAPSAPVSTVFPRFGSWVQMN